MAPRPHHSNQAHVGLGVRAQQALLDAFIPTRCLACDSWEPVGDLGLCLICRSALASLRGDRCTTCLKPQKPQASTRCIACQAKPRSYQQLLALYDYSHPFDRVVQALKFKRMAFLASALAEQMWDRFAEKFDRVDLVVPIPLPLPRRLKRGFNQSAVLAHNLAKRLQRPVIQPLRRRGLTAQSSLDSEKERRHNAQKTLRSRKPRSPGVRALKNATVLLVDDLVTSGATANRASQLLRRAGAESVLVVAAGHRQ